MGRGLLASLLLLCSMLELQAQPLTPQQQYAFGSEAKSLLDPSQQLQLNDVRQRTDWQTSQSEHPNFGYSDAAIWFHRRLDVGTVPWWLWIRYSLLDRVDLYVCQANDCHHQAAGDSLPFQPRAFDHPDLILPIQAQGEVDVYIRLRSQGTSQLPAWLISDAQLRHDLLSHNLLRGGFMGALLVMGLYNLFIALTTRDRSYLLYSGFVLSFLLLHMSYEGSAFQLLWPNLPQLNQYALPMLFGVNQLLLCLFVARFLRLSHHSPIMNRGFSVFAGLMALSVALSLWLPYGSLLLAQNVLSTLITLSALTMGVRVWRKGEKAARYFCIAWLMFIVGMVFTNLRSLGWLPTNALTLFSYQLGSFVEIILLSMALGERITRLQRNELRARQQRLQSQEQAIQYLRSYEDLYHNALSGHFQIDQSGRFTKSNPSWRRMINKSHCDTDQLPSFDELFEKASLDQFWPRLEQQGQIQGHTLITGAGSQRRWLNISMRQRRDGELAGSSAAWIGSAQDVTAQVQQRARLEQMQADKTQSLKQLVMGVAHEMNTPLGNVQMAQSYLSESIQAVRGEGLKQQLLDGCQHIDQGIARLKDLNQVMRSAALLDGQHWRELMHLRSWFRHWRNEILRLDPQLQLKVKVTSFIQHWYGDNDALGRVLNQLVDNSLRHNSGHPLDIRVSVYDSDDALCIRYSDNGCGIASSDRERVFQPFYTTCRSQAGSRGLGLYECHNLVIDVLHGQLHWGDGLGFDLILQLPLSEYHNDDEATTADQPDSAVI